MSLFACYSLGEVIISQKTLDWPFLGWNKLEFLIPKKMQEYWWKWNTKIDIKTFLETLEPIFMSVEIVQYSNSFSVIESYV